MATLAGSLLAVLAMVGPVDAGRTIVGDVVERPFPADRQCRGRPHGRAGRDGSVPILARTKTGADGRFHLARPDAAQRRDFVSTGVIWAYRPGHGLGVVNLIRADRPDQSHRLVLEPHEIRRVTIRDADNKPVAGARWPPGSSRPIAPATWE